MSSSGIRIRDGVDGEVLLARAFLSRVAEPACLPVWDVVGRAGPVAAARAIRARRGTDDLLAATAARCASADPHADLAAADRHGIRLVVPESADWPHFAFACLEAAGAARLAEYRRGSWQQSRTGEPIPPLALWVRGTAERATLGIRSVGIVGARAATPYGEHVASDFGAGLAGRGFEVVSGGAYGIDAAAHRGALAVGGHTVVVSAGGLDRAYPPSNAALFERAAGQGLVVSESPPGAAPQRHRFLTRNRLIAALATGTVIVEAAARSGAANTAGHCFRLGRPVMAVPGPVTSSMSMGCHELLAREHDRAHLVTSADDVVAVIGGAGDIAAEPVPARPPASSLAAELDALDDTARLVFDGLSARRAIQIDELAFAANLSPIDVIRCLPALQLAGLVEAAADGYRISKLAWRLRSRRGVAP
ncbi:MAG TPA: DNA-processing protein DprA [Jatrophihabitans sp.]|nr:DNA-processing protein DprA [Jatrophihabitans sp.]